MSVLKPTILITGSCGYIGSVLFETLHERYPNARIHGFDNLMYNQGVLSIPQRQRSIGSFTKVDLLDEKFYGLVKMIKPDIVFHLAAIVGAPACDTNKDSYEINVESTKKLVSCLTPSQKIIYPNTNSGYGSNADICTEETPLNLISDYARQKYEGELAVLEHPNSVVLRLATVFGLSPRMRWDLLVNNLAKRAYYERKLEIFQGNFRRNYVHIQDVVNAMIHSAANRFTKDRVFNIGNDKINCTKLELANHIAFYLSLFREETVPEVEVTETTEGADGDMRDYIVSSAKAVSKGFVFEYDLLEGIQDLNSYLSYIPKDIMERDQELHPCRNY